MTPNTAPPQPAPPTGRSRQAPSVQSRGPVVERRRAPGAFRGSLERRLPSSALTVEAECLLPPVGRSEAFAEDLFDDSAAASASTGAAGGPGRSRLRWLGLPVLALGVGATLSLASVSGMAALVGF